MAFKIWIVSYSSLQITRTYYLIFIMACEGKTKGTVTWFWQGESPQSFESKKPHVTVTLTPIIDPNNPRWGVKNLAGEIIFEFYAPDYNLFANKSYERQPYQGSYLLEILNIYAQVASQTVFLQPVTVEPLESIGCRIKIFDATGEVFKDERFDKKCPKYKIKCDDDCNEGEIKCKCDSYPGFCCIPCNELTKPINRAAATLRSMKT